MSEQLDWLARNVHEWGKYCGKWTPEDAIGKLRFEGDLALIEPKVCAPFHVTRQQWLDRRAELQNKPSWETAPEWATHLAQQISGYWMWCYGEPTAGQDGGWFGGFSRATDGEVLGDWRDTLERRPTSLGVSAGEALRPLSRADALSWAVENVKTWPTFESGWVAPAGWHWVQMSGSMYLSAPCCPVIGEPEWSSAVEQSYEEFSSVEDAQLELVEMTPEMVERLKAGRCLVRPFKPVLHTIHHAAFLHHDCQLLLNEPELVVFRTADGELLHCKPKECLIDPDTYGLAARLLSDMSGCNVAPEHMRELAEQMGWAV